MRSLLAKTTRRAAESRLLWRFRLHAGRAMQWLEQATSARFGFSQNTAVPFTYLFRDMDDYRGPIRSYFSRDSGELRVLCVGCATGQEPYSVAIFCEEEGIPVRVVGVDLSIQAIEKAKAGIYDVDLEKQRSRAPDTPDAERWIDHYVARYFTESRSRRGEYAVRADIRDRVTFQASDICDLQFDREFDFVICRKMLYYLPAPNRLVAARKMKASLKPGLPTSHIIFDPYTRKQPFFSALMSEIGG